MQLLGCVYSRFVNGVLFHASLFCWQPLNWFIVLYITFGMTIQHHMDINLKLIELRYVLCPIDYI